MGKFVVYVADCESTHLDCEKGDIIELSLLRTTDMVQQTWFMKPINVDNIDDGALKVNGANKEDLLWHTEEGKKKYRSLDEVLPEIENFVSDDGAKSFDRILAGQNINFDYQYMLSAWKKAECIDSFPFSTYGMMIDTKGLALFDDWINDRESEKYSLKNLVKKYGIEQRKAHAASEDVKMTYDVLMNFVKIFKK